MLPEAEANTPMEMSAVLLPDISTGASMGQIQMSHAGRITSSHITSLCFL